MNLAKRSPGSKLVCLEILRFVSAVAVLFWHYQHFFLAENNEQKIDRSIQPLHSFFWIFYDYGLYGVQVFWCISGFIFFWKYKDVISSGGISPGRFFVLRFSRLYPLHFITLLFVAILQWHYFRFSGTYFIYSANDGAHFIQQIFLASNWLPGAESSFNGPIWSISIEVLVYFLFYISLRAFKASFGLCFVVVLFCAVLKFSGLGFPLIDCLACFYFGGMAAIFRQHVSTSDSSYSFDLVAVFLAFVFPFVFLLGSSKIIVAAFVVVYSSLIIFILSGRSVSIGRFSYAIETLGNLTYASYLLHFPFQLVVVLIAKWFGFSIDYYAPAFLLFYVGSILFISYFVYKYYEVPFQDCIRRKLLFNRAEA